LGESLPYIYSENPFRLLFFQLKMTYCFRFLFWIHGLAGSLETAISFLAGSTGGYLKSLCGNVTDAIKCERDATTQPKYLLYVSAWLESSILRALIGIEHLSPHLHPQLAWRRGWPCKCKCKISFKILQHFEWVYVL
jgi:hypothetical protein